MPKDVSERIIDSPFAPTTRAGSVTIGSGGGGGGGGATNFDALTDVTITAPVNGQVPTYNSGTGQWVNAAPAAMVAHALSGSFHTGTLDWSRVDTTGSNLTDITTRQHVDLQGIGPNDHHFQQHVLATGTALGADHTISGAAAGEVLRALSATTAAFDVLQHTDLGNILPDQHHPFVHDIIANVPGFGTAHTVTGADFTVVGVHPADTLALLPTSSAPGAAVSILKTDSNGAIQLDTNLLYVDGANNWIGINRTPSGATLDVIASANADHTQRIKQKSGQTGRMWRIEDTSGNELIVLDSVGNLQSGRPGFVSGLTGWQITPQGNAEFNNIWARGELHATVFVKDEVHATGGTLLVATAGTLHDDAAISSSTVDDDVLVVYSTAAGVGSGVPLQVVTTSGTFVGNELHVSFIGNFINVNDPPSGPGFYFQPGDIIRSKTEVPTGVTDFWLEVNSAVQNDGYSTYSVTKRSGTDGTLPKGAALVSYGREGDGRILMTSDLNYAPYIDVFTVGPNVWTGAAGAIIPRMRMGRLDGIGLPGVSGVTQYGMIAGKDLSDANTGYLIASNLQFSLYKVDIRLNNGVSDTGLWTADGNLKIGSNIGATATTGFNVITTGARAGDVVIGNEATGNFMRWQQSTGILTVTGNLVITDPGTTVTKTYVDAQDVAYDSLAQGYGSTAQTNSQGYSDARRIAGVNGSWGSTTSTTIQWGTKSAGGNALSATFANGGTRTIADHAGTSVSVTSRTYLYVDVAGTGTMTMTPTTSPATIAAVATRVLIAVADPGDANTKACSIAVVAGSTYISGSNIFTGSITATQIAAQTITTGNLASGTITSLNTTAQGYANTAEGNAAADATTKDTVVKGVAAADATTKANTAEQNAKDAAAIDATNKANAANQAAQDYGDHYKLQAVRGSLTVQALPGGRNGITWSSIVLFYADGARPTVTDGSLSGLSTTARSYIHWVYGASTFGATTNLSALSATAALIAVFDPGATVSDPGSLSIVGGATYISGNNIVTGSINTANIKTDAITAGVIAAGAVTAAKIAASAVEADKILVNDNIDVKTNGSITGNGKAYNSATPGFFMGYHSGAYKFHLGTLTSSLIWDGGNMFMKLNQALDITNTSTGNILSMTGTGGSTAILSLDSTGLISSDDFFAPVVRAGKFIQLDATFQIEDARTIAHTTSTGLMGEICWDVNYLYVCYATNLWRRIRLDPLDTW